MSDEIVLRISDLRLALDKVLSAAQSALGDQVELPWDYYWDMPVEAAFDMSRKPSKVTAGQLTDDLEEMTDMSSAGYEPIALWHDLGHLAGLVRAIEKLLLP